MNLKTECNYLVDLDGTLLQAGAALPGACRFFELFGDRLAVVSNNSSHTACLLARQLSLCNLPICHEKIICAGEYCLEMIVGDHPELRVLAVASDEIVSRAKELGIRLVTSDADIVLLCRDPKFSYEKLAAISKEIVCGAKLIVANPDLNHPGGNGLPVPETGALLAAIEACTGKRADRVVGKPAPDLYLEALRRYGWSSEETIIVGDNERTDILGATLLGMRSYLVGPATPFPTMESLLGVLTRKSGRAGKI